MENNNAAARKLTASLEWQSPTKPVICLIFTLALLARQHLEMNHSNTTAPVTQERA